MEDAGCKKNLPKAQRFVSQFLQKMTRRQKNGRKIIHSTKTHMPFSRVARIQTRIPHLTKFEFF
jgi:hypothetical protein